MDFSRTLKVAMDCPYCAEEIKDEAVVCKHCQRDFFIIRPLLKAMSDMSKRIEVLESNAAQPPMTVNVTATPASSERTGSPARHVFPRLSPFAAIVLCIIALLVANYLINYHFELQLKYLRIALFSLPLLFGLLYRDNKPRPLLWDFGAGLLIAVVVTLAGSLIVSITDNDSFLPEYGWQWRELGYYISSIAFGFFAGTLIRQGLDAAQSPGTGGGQIIARTSRYIAVKVASGDETKLEKNLKRVHAALSSSIAIVSAVVSIASSLGVNH